MALVKYDLPAPILLHVQAAGEEGMRLGWLLDTQEM